MATVAARRFADTLSSNARYPAVGGSLSDAARGRVGLLDGVFGALAENTRDIFADPPEETDVSRLRIVLMRDGGLDDDLRDDNEPAAVEERRAEALQTVAEARGIRLTVLTAEGGSALERLASLVAVPDFTSVYLAMAHGLDPTAVPAVSVLKERTGV